MYSIPNYLIKWTPSNTKTKTFEKKAIKAKMVKKIYSTKLRKLLKI
uniref:Uncharacterized protein n=1 Tax=Meloidogyne enterolobii TaxID=390850 RepID=A0A6V7WMP7_MELEN|nr:unnamed protein product [Meloidogyne enterolobii]